MSRIRSGSMARSALILAILFLAAGAGAYALGSGGSNTITVCVHKKGGGLYRASRCQTGDAKLSWNRRGPAGANGTTIVERTRGTGPAATSGTPQSSTMTANHWTQAANELDTVVGQATVQEPALSDCSGGSLGLGDLFGSLLVDGKVVASLFAVAPASAQTQTVSFGSTGDLFEPGVATHHTLTAQFSDSCTGTAHFSVRKVAVDVEGAR